MTKRLPAKNDTSSTWTSDTEPRVTFAHTMPRSNGAQIFSSAGTPNLGMIKVAIPDGAGAVRFVRGNDPEAVRYLETTRAEQKQLIMDNGPSDVGLSQIVNFGPLKGRATRRVRNLAADPK